MSALTFFSPHKRTICFYGILLSFLLCVGLLTGLYQHTDDTRKFRQLTTALFQESFSDDTLSLHYTLAYPEKYGIHTEPVLPILLPSENSQEEEVKLQSTLTQLNEISPEELSPADAFTYKLLKRYLNKHLSGAGYSYYSEPLSASSGMQSGLPVLLADYTFRRTEDVEDYLALLDQTDTYFNSLIAYEVQKAEAGLFMSSASAQKVIEQCNNIMDQKSLEEGTHFLHLTFQERLQPLVEAGTITSKEAAVYTAENDRLLTTVMQPAYEQTADALTLLDGKGRNTQGLCHFPEGKAYYEYLLSVNTASDRPVSEIKTMLFEDYQANFNSLITLLRAHPELAEFSGTSGIGSSASSPASSDLSPSEIINSLQQQMSTDFPPFPAQTESFAPACTIKYVSPSMTDYCSPAYYLIPPLDDMQNNIIYINQKSMPDQLTLFTTLAHEGYPGHLYQTVYSQLYRNSRQEDPVRSLLHYGGYVEGWALYVENLSYLYAKEQVEAKNPETALYYECCRLNRNMNLCLYSLLDIAIHYDGASMTQAAQILQSAGISNQGTVAAIYEYIVEEPANYPKYYVGFLEMNALKDTAMTLWGEDFSNYRFHKFILETGPSDFTSLGEQLTEASTVYSSSSIPSRYPLSQRSIFSFRAASTAGAVKY